jgi:hypothetical protein
LIVAFWNNSTFKIAYQERFYSTGEFLQLTNPQNPHDVTFAYRGMGFGDSPLISHREESGTQMQQADFKDSGSSC